MSFPAPLIKTHSFIWPLAAVVLSAFGIFILDLVYPLEVTAGIPYAVIILFSLRHSNKNLVLWAAGSGTVFSILSLVLTPPEEASKPAFIGAYISLAAIWGTAVVGLQTRKVRDALQMSEARYHRFIYSVPNVTWATDRQGRTDFISPNIEKIYGYTPEEMYAGGDHLRFGRIHFQDVDRVRQGYESHFEKGVPFDLEYRLQRKDGSWIWVHEKAVGTIERDGGLFAEGILSDISKQKAAEEALNSRENMLKLAQSLAGFGTWEWDTHGNVIKCSEDYFRLFGLAPKTDPPACAQWLEWTHAEDRARIQEEIHQGLKRKAINDFDFRVLWPDGSVHWLALKGRVLLNEVGNATGVIGVNIDITEWKRTEEIMQEQTVRDALTGLYNRRYFSYRVKEEITRAEREKKPLALLLCDLEGLKVVNASLGHHSGDNVLIAVGRSIQDSLRRTDLVFRWGGSQFLVIVTNTSRDGTLTVAQRIREGVKQFSRESNLNLEMSVGIAFYREHGKTEEDLIHFAERALYIAQRAGERIHIGIEEFSLDEKSIKVVFQPVVDCVSRKVIGFEALGRDPSGKLSILELFQRYRAVGQLDALKRICFRFQLKVAQAIGLQRVFLNVDYTMLNQMDPFPKPPDMDVIFEISELEPLHDISRRLETVERWRRLGYKIGIDDFGAGFVSFPFLTQLVPDYIKVDRSSILQAIASEQYQEFLKGILSVLKGFVKEGIVAEGVETEKETAVVKKMGLRLVQGFLYGKPKELN